jgi:hypothetical protein
MLDLQIGGTVSDNGGLRRFDPAKIVEEQNR